MRHALDAGSLLVFSLSLNHAALTAKTGKWKGFPKHVETAFLRRGEGDVASARLGPMFAMFGHASAIVIRMQEARCSGHHDPIEDL